jgi:hypothetical protein
MSTATLQAQIAALPEAVQVFYFAARKKWHRVDPAAAFIAHAEGHTPSHCAARARRQGAAGWREIGFDEPPDATAYDDPAALLAAREQAAAELAAPGAEQRLQDAGCTDAWGTSRALAEREGITQRRAQQLAKRAIEAAKARQLELFTIDGDEEGGE